MCAGSIMVGAGRIPAGNGGSAIAYPVAMDFQASDEAPARRALVFGGTGQIGERVLDRLHAAGWQVLAFSRSARSSAAPGLRWVVGDLSQPWTGAEYFDAVFSCGPLDHFARWYAQSAIDTARVVAFGSTSIEVKQDSADAAERDVARRLQQAEALLFTAAAERGVAATVLRPTLVYGAGRDRTLTAIATLAARTGVFVLPRSAAGLRQPVHVQDLAEAALAVLDQPVTAGQAYALGGGEVLAYQQMVARTLASLPTRPRLLRAPSWVFAAVVRLAHLGGRLSGLNAAVIQRMSEPLVFDLAPARRDFGYAPRAFVAEAAMFTAPIDKAQ